MNQSCLSANKYQSCSDIRRKSQQNYSGEFPVFPLLVYRAFIVLWLWSHDHPRLDEPPWQDQLENKVELVNKALLSYHISKDSIDAWPIGIVRRIEAKEAGILDKFEY
jgi:hypothetical protein